jgi:hypothetical protein
MTPCGPVLRYIILTKSEEGDRDPRFQETANLIRRKGSRACRLMRE